MPSNNHIIAGLPAWATQEEADAAAAALGYEVAEAAEDAAAARARKMRANHAAAGRYYWAAAYAALTRREFPAMRAMAAQAAAADEAASPNGALLAAVFGGCARPAEARAVAQGRDLPAHLVEQARKAVQAEMAAHGNRQQARRDADRAAQAQTRRVAEKAERQAAAAAEAAALPIGAVLTASRSYKLAKHSDNVATIATPDGGFEYVEVLGAPQGEFQVRIVSHKRGSAYGYSIAAVAELVA